MGVMHDNYAASEVLSHFVATSLEGKVLNHTFTCGNLQDTPTVTSEAQSSDDGDLESDHSIDSEPAAQQGGEPSTSQDEGREVTAEPAAQHAQGGEASTPNRDEADHPESTAQQVTEYSMAMNCLKSLESSEFEVGYYHVLLIKEPKLTFSLCFYMSGFQ